MKENFNVGDKVRIIKHVSSCDLEIGSVGTIMHIRNKFRYPIECDFGRSEYDSFKPEELEKIY